MSEKIDITTGGGPYIAGNVHTMGGDFIGGNQINHYGVGLEKATPETHRTYLQWLIERNTYLDPRGTYQTQRQVQLKLDEVYITLRARSEEKPSLVDRRLLEEDLPQLEANIKLTDQEREELREQLPRFNERREKPAPLSIPIALDEVITRYERIAMLGDPGSGKTTLLRHLALSNARRLYQGQPASFPILLRIAAYAENNHWKNVTLTDFIPTYFRDQECSASGLAVLLQQELAQGNCLVLFDGLDEIVEASDRRGIVGRIENFVRRYGGGGLRGSNRFVITSRIAGYRNAPLGEPFTHYEIQEMDDVQIKRFVERWCRAVEDAQTPDLSHDVRQTIAQREIDGILKAVAHNRGVRRLAANPLMLRTLALIHRTGAQLPQRRIELYKLATDTLARTWRTAQGVPESALVDERYLTRLLGKIAYWLHLHKSTGLVTESEVYEVLGEEWAAISGRVWDPANPNIAIEVEVEKFLSAVREHTGLFVERAPKRYGFMHLTFEEYYAARHLVARSRARPGLIRQHLHDPRWDEPILLALGFVGLDYPEEAAELLETAILAQSDEAIILGFQSSQYEDLLGRDYLFALRCLGDQIPAHPNLIEPLMKRLADELLYRVGLARFARYRLVLVEHIPNLSSSVGVKFLVMRLLSSLQNSNEIVRRRAAQTLGQLGFASSNVVGALVFALQDGDVEVRCRAAESLGQLGQTSPEITTALIGALQDFNIEVRRISTESLRRLGQTSQVVIEKLLMALHDKNVNTRRRAAQSLGHLGQSSQLVIEALVTALQDKDVDTRRRAAQSLGHLGQLPPTATESLIKALHDVNAGVRISVTESLGQSAQTSPITIDALVTALHDENEIVRITAAESLGILGQRAPIVIQALLEALRDNDVEVQCQAINSLAQLNHASAEVVTALIVALSNIDERIRQQAAASLGQLGQPSSIITKSLMTALDDLDQSVRHQAATSLGQLGQILSIVIEVLVYALQQDESPLIRKHAAQLLGEVTQVDQGILEILQQGLLDDDNDVRTTCGATLARLGKRFPELRQNIAQQLVELIHNPAFGRFGKFANRSGQDHAHEALWLLIAR